MAAVAVKAAAVANKANRNKKKPHKYHASISPEEDNEEEEAIVIEEGIWKYQAATARFYKDVRVEVFVAGLIAANFITNIVEKQVWPSGDPNVSGGSSFESTFAGFELFYNIAFTLELIINMYAFWLYEFWNSGWNIFDFVVVMIGLLDTAKAPLPGPLSMLRMMRAFRVFRLFKRVKSLNKIIVSLAKAVPGVMNAFLIMLLVMCIFAILATDLFRDVGQNGKITFETATFQREYDNFTGEYVDGSGYYTARGGWFGKEYFGNFFKSLYTLFQVLTGESWSEAIARPLIEGWSPIGAGIFFVIFILLNAVVLINVVVAVLLEKMVDDEDSDADQEDGGSEEEDQGALVLAQAANSQVATQISEIKDELGKLQATMALLVARLDSSMGTLPPVAADNEGKASPDAADNEGKASPAEDAE